MMDPILDHIEQTLRAMSDAGAAETYRRFFKTGRGQYGEGDVFLGIPVPALRKTARAFATIPLSVCGDLLASRYHEERMFALILLTGRFRKAAIGDREAVFQLYMDNIRRVNSWDLVDVSAPVIVGGYFMDRDPGPLEAMANADDLWERRIGMTATLAFIRKKNLAPTFRIADLLLKDREDLIQKAVGWMLREAGKKDIAALETFLKPRYRDMPRIMLRYAIERLPEERRSAYLKGRI